VVVSAVAIGLKNNTRVMKCAAFSLYSDIAEELFPPVLNYTNCLRALSRRERVCRMACKEGTKKEKIKQKSC